MSLVINQQQFVPRQPTMWQMSVFRTALAIENLNEKVWSLYVIECYRVRR